MRVLVVYSVPLVDSVTPKERVPVVIVGVTYEQDCHQAALCLMPHRGPAAPDEPLPGLPSLAVHEVLGAAQVREGGVCLVRFYFIVFEKRGQPSNSYYLDKDFVGAHRHYLKVVEEWPSDYDGIYLYLIDTREKTVQELDYKVR